MMSYMEQKILKEDALLRRERKIRHHLRQKDLEEKMTTWTLSRLERPDEEEEEELHRDIILKQCELQILEVWNILDSLTTEMDLLKYQSEKENSQDKHETNSSLDASKTCYPLKLLPNSITTLNEELRQKVFTSSHRLPTMTIDDYLYMQQQQGLFLSNINEK